MTAIEEAGRLGLALAMAVFIGLAFEGTYKRDERSNPGGIRTFPMLAILGAMLSLLDLISLLPYVVGLAAIAAWLYAHIRLAPAADGQRPSLMIPAANLFAYTLGPLALKQPPWILISASIVAVLLLQGRDALHRLVQQVAPEEAFTLGKFLILVGVILPLLPNHPIVNWTTITPVQVWLALVAISGLSYISYLLQRYLPSTHPLLPAVLGGVYSPPYSPRWVTFTSAIRVTLQSAVTSRSPTPRVVAALRPRAWPIPLRCDPPRLWHLRSGALDKARRIVGSAWCSHQMLFEVTSIKGLFSTLRARRTVWASGR